jgi:MFS family permease
MTGLLVAPTGVGAMLAMRSGARLTDRFGSGRTALAGGLISAVATIPFTLLGPATSYWWLGASMVVRGIGIGLCMMPAMTAAYRAVPPSKISDGTVQLSVLSRLGGSVGTAIFTVVLQHELASGAGAGAFAVAFRWALGAAVLAALPAVVLAVAESRASGTVGAAAAPSAAAPVPVPQARLHDHG